MRRRATGWTRSSTGLVSARRRRRNSCCAGCCRWPGRDSVSWRVSPVLADRLLGIIEQRCLTGQTGAAWQIATVDALTGDGGVDRREALRLMTQRYIEHMHANQPVHTWPVSG